MAHRRKALDENNRNFIHLSCKRQISVLVWLELLCTALCFMLCQNSAVLCLENHKSFSQDSQEASSRQQTDQTLHDLSKRSAPSLNLAEDMFATSVSKSKRIPFHRDLSDVNYRAFSRGTYLPVVFEAPSRHAEDANKDTSEHMSLITDDLAEQLAALDQAVAILGMKVAANAQLGDFREPEVDHTFGQTYTRPSSRLRSGKRQQRPVFGAWGGKRSAKRPTFHAWSGKRSATPSEDMTGHYDVLSDDSQKSMSFDTSWLNKNIDKRPWFNSWSGRKRSIKAVDLFDDDAGYSDIDDTLFEDTVMSKRQAFHAWSGKRDGMGGANKRTRPSAEQQVSPEAIESAKAETVLKLLELQRNEIEAENNSQTSREDIDTPEAEKRRGFHSWGGKRSSRIDENLILGNSVGPSHYSHVAEFDDKMSLTKLKQGLISIIRLLEHGNEHGSERNIDKKSTYSLMAAIGSTLGGIEYGGKSFGELLPSPDGREEVLKALKSLYSQLVSLDAAPVSNSAERSENLEAYDNKPPPVQTSKPKVFASHYRSPNNWRYIKRPAFHSWSGKRSNYLIGDEVHHKDFNSFPSVEFQPALSSNSWMGKRRKRSVVSDVIRNQRPEETEHTENMENENSQKVGVSESLKTPHESRKVSVNNLAGYENSETFPSAYDSKAFVFYPKESKSELVNGDIQIQEATDSEKINDEYVGKQPAAMLHTSDQVDSMENEEENVNNDLKKRPAFHSWSRKRESYDKSHEVLEASYDTDKRQRMAFNSWGGKRSDDKTNSILEDAGNGQGSDTPGDVVHSWGKNNDKDQEKVEEIPTNNNMHAEKRARMGFKSWAGKRNGATVRGDEFVGDEGVDLDKTGRMSFNSWAGERFDNSEVTEQEADAEKRRITGFHSWGGKRSGAKGDDSSAEADHEDKRPHHLGFNSWGGKRRARKYNNTYDTTVKKSQLMGFNPWGGKRSLGEIGNREMVEKRTRFGFNSWAGKRSNDESVLGNNNSKVEKRGRIGFHSWGGKRDGHIAFHDSVDDDNDHKGGDEKRNKMGFSAWAGKRSVDIDTFNQRFKNNNEKRRKMGFSAWAGKRGVDINSKYQHYIEHPDGSKRGKVGFSAWAGKRSLATDVPDGVVDQINEDDSLQKRGRLGFHSWGGKRGDDDIIVGAVDTNKEIDEAQESGSVGFHGKISEGGNDRDSNFNKRVRMGFNSWAGKRSPMVPRGADAVVGVDNESFVVVDDPLTDKRAGKYGFGSLGSKRSAETETAVLSPEKRPRMGLNSLAGERGVLVPLPRFEFPNYLENQMSEPLNKRRAKMGFSSWAGKRNEGNFMSKKGGRVGFHSWAGKRNNDDKDLLDKRGHRMAFSSWAGKRTAKHLQDDLGEEKRQRMGFHAWGGKRNEVDGVSDASEAYNSDVNDANFQKRGRLGFNAWGGKRSEDDTVTQLSGKRRRMGFHSWGGKRGVPFDPYTLLVARKLLSTNTFGKRSALESWSLRRKELANAIINELRRRTMANINNDSHKNKSDQEKSNDVSMTNKNLLSKRPAFHAWSGKISDTPVYDIVTVKRPAFSSWGGKRGFLADNTQYPRSPMFPLWSVKEILNPIGGRQKRPSFHAWSGKRAISFSNTGLPEKRPSFHAWSGKRNVPTTNHVIPIPQIGSPSIQRQATASNALNNDFVSSLVTSLNAVKRPAFHAWSGKRSSSQDINHDIPPDSTVDKRPAFSSWNGKRTAISETSFPFTPEGKSTIAKTATNYKNQHSDSSDVKLSEDSILGFSLSS